MDNDLARLWHAYQHRNFRQYELCKSEFIDLEVLHKHETTSPGKKGKKCKIYGRGFSDSRRFVKNDRHTAHHDKLLLSAFTLKMFCQNYFVEIIILHMVQP